MPKTRLTQTRVAADEQQADVAPSEQELTEAEGTTPSASSFKGRLTRYAYSETTGPDPATALPASRPQRAAKRALAPDTEPSSRPSPRPKKKRAPSKYADPSKYAHLSPLVDILELNLICVFVGTNPGVQTATAGHAYAHPSNSFWKLLHTSGLTHRRLSPTEDRSLPALYCMGNTNIVSRPSKDAAELSREEMLQGAEELDAKIEKYKPEAVCIVGKGIWEAIFRWKYGKGMGKGEFKYGWQEGKMGAGKGNGNGKVGSDDADGRGWKGSRVFVATSTSGLAANLKPAEKEAIWKPFGEWVQKRRVERGFVPRSTEAEEPDEQ